jgi:hypothetical protein
MKPHHHHKATKVFYSCFVVVFGIGIGGSARAV